MLKLQTPDMAVRCDLWLHTQWYSRSCDEADPLHIFKDQVEFPPPTEGLLQLHDVVLLQSPKHLQLPKRRLLDFLILCTNTKRGRNEAAVCLFLSLILRSNSHSVHSPSLSLNFLIATSSLVSCEEKRTWGIFTPEKTMDLSLFLRLIDTKIRYKQSICRTKGKEEQYKKIADI